jgi:hypothetical protein
VNCTKVPGQTGLADAVIEILTGKRGFTTMVISLEIAGLPAEQGRLDVNAQLIASLFWGL